MDDKYYFLLMSNEEMSPDELAAATAFDEQVREASAVVEARERGMARSGEAVPVPGTGRHFKGADKGGHPHNKPARMDPNRRDRIADQISAE